MSVLLVLLGLTFFQHSIDSTVSDTLYIFDAIDSTYSKEFVEVTFDNSQSILTTDYSLPPDLFIKNLDISLDSVAADSLYFSNFEIIPDGDQEYYPLSTTVKLFIANNDTVSSQCSGMMVSKKHVLTAAHCIFNRELYPQIYAYAGYHKNNLNNLLQLTQAVKYYTTVNIYSGETFFENDIALLELEKEIGDGKGWIGMGFINSNEKEYLKDQLIHSLSYPAARHILDSTIVYDGEELVIGYGFSRATARDNLIEIKSVGTPGQSGSSLFVKDSSHGYFSVGSLSLTSVKSMYYQAFDAFTFLAFKQVMDKSGTTIGEEDVIASVKLYQNFPNPFNPTTHIPFEVTKTQKVSLNIFDITGRKISSLISNERKSPGNYLIRFDAEDLSSGVYLYVIQGESFRESKKLLLIK